MGQIKILLLSCVLAIIENVSDITMRFFEYRSVEDSEDGLLLAVIAISHSSSPSSLEVEFNSNTDCWISE